MSLLLFDVLNSSSAGPDRIVYARLIVYEALCHGGQGWLASFSNRLSSRLVIVMFSEPSLMPSIVSSQRLGSGSFCSLCQRCDHSPSNCATTFLQHPVHQGLPLRSTQICLSCYDGHCAAAPRPCFWLRHLWSAKITRICPQTPGLGILPRGVVWPLPQYHIGTFF